MWPALLNKIKAANIIYTKIRSVCNGITITPDTKDDYKSFAKLLKANKIAVLSGVNTPEHPEIKSIKVVIRKMILGEARAQRKR